MYDILCAKDFNPNERTGAVFSKGNMKFLLPEQLRRAILSFYAYQHTGNLAIARPVVVKKTHHCTGKVNIRTPMQPLLFSIS